MDLLFSSIIFQPFWDVREYILKICLYGLNSEGRDMAGQSLRNLHKLRLKGIADGLNGGAWTGTSQV